MTEEVRKLCNQQIVHELHASHVYLAMAAFLDREGLHGAALFMRAQSDEERDHAMRFYDHLQERDVAIEIGTVPESQHRWPDARTVFEEALKHEQKVSGQISALYDAAEKVGDRPLQNLLDWFVDEQVEEEHTFTRILELFDHVESGDASLLEIDERLGERDASEDES